MKRRQLEELVAILISMVRRAAREMERKPRLALLDDLNQLLHDYGWHSRDESDR